MTTSTLNFEQIFRKYRPGLLAFANSILNNIDDAEEVIHDVFIAFWNQGSLRDIEESGVKSYLFTSVKNRSLNHIKKAKLNYTDLPEYVDFVDLSPNVLREIEGREVEQRIHKIIDELPEKCRQIFIMSRVYELSHKEIATILEVSPKTVENQVGLALKFIRKYFIQS